MSLTPSRNVSDTHNYLHLMGAHDRPSRIRVQSVERAREDHSALYTSPAFDTGPASLFCGRFATDDPP